jgi:hypothetical protein
LKIRNFSTQKNSCKSVKIKLKEDFKRERKEGMAQAKHQRATRQSIKAIKVKSLTIKIENFSIERLQDSIGWEYTVTGETDDRFSYCDVVSNKNGSKEAYIEFNNHSVTKVIGFIESIVTSDDKVITITKLKQDYGKDIQSGVCLSPDIDIEDTIYPYVISGKCSKCPFNKTGKCEYLQINDIQTTLIEEFNIVLKEYQDLKTGLEIKEN